MCLRGCRSVRSHSDIDCPASIAQCVMEGCIPQNWPNLEHSIACTSHYYIHHPKFVDRCHPYYVFYYQRVK